MDESRRRSLIEVRTRAEVYGDEVKARLNAIPSWGSRKFWERIDRTIPKYKPDQWAKLFEELDKPPAEISDEAIAMAEPKSKRGRPKGYRVSDETKARMSEAQKARWESGRETILGLRRARKEGLNMGPKNGVSS